MKYLSDVTDFVVKYVGLLFVVTTPIHPIVGTTLALVVADMITGVWSAIKLGEPFTSKKLKRKIPITVCYVAGLVLFYFVETYMVSDIPLVKTLAAMIAFNESKSIAENVYKITGIDLMKLVIEKLGGSVKSDDSQSK